MPHNQGVTGSSPVGTTKKPSALLEASFVSPSAVRVLHGQKNGHICGRIVKFDRLGQK